MILHPQSSFHNRQIQPWSRDRAGTRHDNEGMVTIFQALSRRRCRLDYHHLQMTVSQVWEDLCSASNFFAPYLPHIAKVREDCVRSYSEGSTLEETAEQAGVDVRTASRWIKRVRPLLDNTISFIR